MSTSPIRRGNQTPQQQRYREHYSPINGLQTETEWQTFDANQAVALANVAASGGNEYELDRTFDRYTLRVTDSRGIITIDSWEVACTRANLDLREHPTVRYIIASSGDAEKVTAAVKAASESADPYTAYPDLATYVTASGQLAILKTFLDLYRKGSTSFYTSQYILRHNTNTPARSNFNVADIGVDHLYTTAQAISEAQDGLAWIYPMPERLAYKMNQILSQAQATYNTPTGYAFSWLKGGSSESTAANNRVNITTEYEFALWSTNIYPVY